MDCSASTDATALDALCTALAGPGWHATEALPGHALLAAAADELRAPAQRARLQAAATGRAAGRLNAGLRGDATRWLEAGRESPATERLLRQLDDLRQALNRRLFLGLDHLECHVACYPPGAGYVRHLDRFRDDDARVLSLVMYLNAEWPDDAGGALRLHLPEGARDITPRLGTAVWFLSADIEHEVLAATRERWSIAGWFRRR
jgi:SM-20-related protein